jgi:hypothetical protein
MHRNTDHLHDHREPDPGYNSELCNHLPGRIYNTYRRRSINLFLEHRSKHCCDYRVTRNNNFLYRYRNRARLYIISCCNGNDRPVSFYFSEHSFDLCRTIRYAHRVRSKHLFMEHRIYSQSAHSQPGNDNNLYCYRDRSWRMYGYCNLYHHCESAAGNHCQLGNYL